MDENPSKNETSYMGNNGYLAASSHQQQQQPGNSNASLPNFMLQQGFSAFFQQQQQQPAMNTTINANAMAAMFAAFQATFQQQIHQQHSQQPSHAPSPPASQMPAYDPNVFLNQMATMNPFSAGINASAQPSPVAAATPVQDYRAAATPPTYVNAKQFRRILKRRDARRIMDEYFARKRKAAEAKKPYMHESRHKHAMKRPRGPGGRFLTKAELEEYYKNNPSPADADSEPVEDDDNHDDHKKPRSI